MASPEEMAQTMIQNMEEKTGKTLPQWLAITVDSVFSKHGEILKHLKQEHGVTHGFASLIAHETLNARKGESEEVDLVSAQYQGPKADLKPIYDKLVLITQGFGSAMELAPKKAYVSLRHKKQFALIQPSTKTRVDLGINLKDVDATGNLEVSGSFNAMVSHRVRLSSPDDVDENVTAWLKQAFEQAG